MNRSEPMKKVAVVGAEGRMGRWFTHYFTQSNAFKVYIYDKKRRELKNKENVKRCATVKACVKEADLVMVCVPISTVVTVVQECLRYMKKGAILSEISSIKTQIFSVLHSSRKDITYLCIHPMFGPATKKAGPIKSLLIPVRNRAKELSLLNYIFPQSQVEIIKDPKLHDSYMAVVLGLTYFLNLVLASMLSNLDLITLKKVAGTSFGMQVMITESIVNDSPELVSSLIRENPSNEIFIDHFLSEAEKLRRLVGGKEERVARNAVEDIKNRINRLTNTDKSYLKFYRAIEYLNTLEIEKLN